MSNEDYPKVCIHVEESLLDDCSVCKTIKKLKEDTRLEYWTKWLNRRKEVHKLLEQTVNRKPEELLMNTFEDVKTIEEEKLVLQYANIPEADAQRGCPGFWKLPMSLNEPCALPKYFSVQSKLHGCDVPDIEYVKVPNAIKEEKDASTIRYD